MQKIVIEKPGGYSQLKIMTCSALQPDENEVVVSTKGIGVNYADCLVRFGVYESAKKYVGWPITPGFEFSGVIESVGHKVTRFKIGDRVYGITRFFAYATQVKVNESQVFNAPEGIDLYELAGFPVVYFTAYHHFPNG
jgi:NADPH:quinone reductase-like Zn-dependent oxidoreductase